MFVSLFIVFVPFFFGLIAVDGDTLNPSLGYRQQEIAFFSTFFKRLKNQRKPEENAVFLWGET